MDGKLINEEEYNKILENHELFKDILQIEAQVENYRKLEESYKILYLKYKQKADDLSASISIETFQG